VSKLFRNKEFYGIILKESITLHRRKIFMIHNIASVRKDIMLTDGQQLVGMCGYGTHTEERIKKLSGSSAEGN